MRVTDIVSFVFSILASVVAYLVGEIFLSYTYQNISDELFVGLYFSIVGIIIVSIMCLCIYKISKVKDEIPANNIFFKSLSVLTIITILISFVLGAGFEFLYSLGSSNSSSNYIVAIDNSGSMENNDPLYERFNALDELFYSIKNNQKMGVYVFNSNNVNVIELQNIDKSNIQKYHKMLEPYKISDGGTELMRTLKDIINYIETKNIKQDSSVIVISDGECDVDYNVLNKFNDKNIPIHTIGVADTYNSLYDISTQTGGIYYDIDNIQSLGQTFNTIYNLNSNRTLITRRTGVTSGMISYIFMRIVFIFILALIIKIMELFILDIPAIRDFILIQCVLFSVLAGLFTEFLIQNPNINESLVRFFMILLMSILFVTHLRKSNNVKNNLAKEFDFSPNKNSIDNKIEEKRKGVKK